jgi:60 kDa SS-A/Ro ribonucleoprotein
MQRYTGMLSRTPQQAPIPGVPGMVPNRAGGWGFEVSDRVLAERFILLGTVHGSYYAEPEQLTGRAIDAIDRLLESGDGEWLVQKIVEISTLGRAPKQDPGILALALALKTAPDRRTRRLAADAAPRVCRTVSTASDLADALKGLGPAPAAEGHNREKPAIRSRAQRRAIAGCFEAWARDPARLAYQLIKYGRAADNRRRGPDGSQGAIWRAVDLARLSHFRASNPEVDALMSWLHGRKVANLPAQVRAYEEVQRVAAVPGQLSEHFAGEKFATEARAKATERIAELVREHRLPWECVPSEFVNLPSVQRALFEDMPLHTMIRQLGRLTAGGLFDAPSSVQMAVDRLRDVERIRKARVHPMAAYLAAMIYGSGHGLKGKGSWRPVPEIKDALMAAFLGSFRSLNASGRQIVVGVDCSGSMVQHDVLGIPGFSAQEAAFIMAWATARVEPRARVVAFGEQAEEIELRDVQTLDELRRRARMVRIRHNRGTDCSLPILYALERPNWGEVDAFVIYTDEETWYSPTIHPIEALWQYRARWERRTRLVSAALVANHYSLVNTAPDRGESVQDDAGVLAVTGFDSAAPAIIADFVRSGDG